LGSAEDVAQKLAEVEDKDEILKVLRTALADAVRAYRTAAGALTMERKAAAGKLANWPRGKSTRWL